MSVQLSFPLYSPVYVPNVTYAQGLHVVIGYSPRVDANGFYETLDLILWSTTEGEDTGSLIISADMVVNAPTGTCPVIKSSLFQSEHSINKFNHDLTEDLKGKEVIYLGEIKTILSASLIGYVPFVDNNGDILNDGDGSFKKAYRVVFTDYYTGYMSQFEQPVYSKET